MKARERIGRFCDKKVMIIEECRELREIISSICSHWGASTIGARSSRELVFKALTEKPDLIIFHPGSERNSTHYTCKLLKSLKETRHIPILLSTGDCQTLKTKDLDLPGYDDYILKPFGTEELVMKMERLFR
ncbi:MAG: hypothetical protein OEV42_19890 [Deltaproteobacteria bacterium]|nr:hypothetical protein [Deltaproteobacteria bacterium]